MTLWDEAERRYDGPIPEEIRRSIYAATHPPRASRQASILAWSTVRFWARRANAAKRSHDLLELDGCEFWLNKALNTWAEIRREELAPKRAA